MMKTTLFQKIYTNWKSGAAVSLVSIPLAVSLAVASHTSPVVGIITAIWAGIIASFFGGSNYNIIGPTGALSGMLAAYAISHGSQSLAMLAIVSGLFIFIAYLFKFERYLIFFPASTIHGFILGVAFIISLNQLNAAFGLSNIPQHENFLRNVLESCSHLNELSWPTLVFFTLFLIVLFFLVKLTPRIPGSIILAPVAIGIGLLSSNNFLPFTLQTLESKYPTLSPQLFELPTFHFAPSLLIPAATIAIVSILETMISARIADGLTKTKHDKRKEMLGLSFANIASGLAGGMPATAALARTALNVKTGATDKISATISSVFVVIVSFMFLSYFKYIPLAAIAAMLIFVSIKMVEKEHFTRMYRTDKKTFILSLAVAFITIYEDPIIGLLAGATIAMLIFMEKISQGHFELRPHTAQGTIQEEILNTSEGQEQATSLDTLVYAIKGQLAYINAQSHISQLEEIPNNYKNIILDLRGLHFIDLDGIEAFGEIVNLLHANKKNIYISSVRPFIVKMFEESHEFKQLQTTGHVFKSTEKALLFLKEQPK